MQQTFIDALRLAGLTIKSVIVWDKKAHGMGDLKGSFAPRYRVRVTTDELNIRKGPGTNYGTNGSIKDKGIYTITAEAEGPGASKWGKLKSGAGWISLDYTAKV